MHSNQHTDPQLKRHSAEPCIVLENITNAGKQATHQKCTLICNTAQLNFSGEKGGGRGEMYWQIESLEEGGLCQFFFLYD